MTVGIPARVRGRQRKSPRLFLFPPGWESWECFIISRDTGIIKIAPYVHPGMLVLPDGRIREIKISHFNLRLDYEIINTNVCCFWKLPAMKKCMNFCFIRHEWFVEQNAVFISAVCTCQYVNQSYATNMQCMAFWRTIVICNECIIPL